jgi:peptidoglycan/xylan/chitin deacetylase (PgdA/CDA1 family)
MTASAVTTATQQPAVSRDDGADEPEPDEIEDPRAGTQQIIWSLDIDQRFAALTFDDGPHPDLTPRILEALDRAGVKATFMVMGHAAQQHPGLIRDIVAAGHELGHHGWRHLNLAKVGVETTREEIAVGCRVVEDAAGVPVRLFRPPRGRLSEGAVRLLAGLRHDIILWSVTRGEKRWRSPERVARHVVDHTGPGAIVDLHDGIGRGTFVPGTQLAHDLLARRTVEVEALPRILFGCAERGVQLGTVTDLRGAPTRPGGTA